MKMRCQARTGVKAPGVSLASVPISPVRHRRCASSVVAQAQTSGEGQVSRRSMLYGAASSLLLPSAGAVIAAPEPQSIYEFSALMYGEEVSMSKYKGQVLVVVNVASE
mmetsp:Transcript_31659/g.70403  ORF Transcript_31659/g.70403 Transcript_31659/m.70403 type:complete len:108 (+) Transcript_31659:49-372(+)